MQFPPTIVFSHANGFPAGTYRVLVDTWRAVGYTVHAIEKYGHDERFPVTSNWPHLRNQLIQFVEHEAVAPVFLVGHSLGGYLSLLAASRRPELVRGVILLDSPILAGPLAKAVQFAKAMGIGERFSPGRVSKRRRQHWPNAEAAYAHFAAKPAFARWPPEVLRDYIASGVQPITGVEGHGLAFRREIETTIYNTVPHHMTALLRKHPLKCPLAFVGGTRSTENRQVGLRATERLTHGRMSWVEGSHLFPFERPADASEAVVHWLQAFSSPAAA